MKSKVVRELTRARGYVLSGRDVERPVWIPFQYSDSLGVDCEMKLTLFVEAGRCEGDPQVWRRVESEEDK